MEGNDRGGRYSGHKMRPHTWSSANRYSCCVLRNEHDHYNHGSTEIDALEAIEQKTGKPAISSNQAMLWHCLRMAGIADKVDGYGRLFREH